MENFEFAKLSFCGIVSLENWRCLTLRRYNSKISQISAPSVRLTLSLRVRVQELGIEFLLLDPLKNPETPSARLI